MHGGFDRGGREVGLGATTSNLRDSSRFWDALSNKPDERMDSVGPFFLFLFHFTFLLFFFLVFIFFFLVSFDFFFKKKTFSFLFLWIFLFLFLFVGS